MRNLGYLFFVFALATLFSSCLYDSEIAQPNIGCDTTYFATVIKPIINNNCAVSGCHVTGGVGSGNFSSYAGIKPYLEAGVVSIRINLDPSDPLHMPQGSILDSLDKVKLNDWINAGYIGCD